MGWHRGFSDEWEESVGERLFCTYQFDITFAYKAGEDANPAVKGQYEHRADNFLRGLFDAAFGAGEYSLESAGTGDERRSEFVLTAPVDSVLKRGWESFGCNSFDHWLRRVMPEREADLRICSVTGMETHREWGVIDVRYVGSKSYRRKPREAGDISDTPVLF